MHNDRLRNFIMVAEGPVARNCAKVYECARHLDTPRVMLYWVTLGSTRSYRLAKAISTVVSG